MINVICNLIGTAGYDIHSRELCKALSKQTDIRIETGIQPGQEKELTDKEIELIKKPNNAEINLIITHPLYWKRKCNAKRNWCYLIWEGNKLPDHFIECCLNPDIEYILVASDHTKLGVMNTTKDKRILNKIRIIPHGVDLNLFYPQDKQIDKFTFLVSKGWRNLEDRGGTQYAIKAFAEEFKPTENVRLLIKINPAYGIPNIDFLMSQLNLPKELPQIQFIIDSVPYNQLVHLYNSCNVFVMPSRGEAFGIPGIEAMACSKPVISTNFGGQTDYINGKNGWLISGKLTEIKHELAYEGISWLTPNINQLRQKMRWCFENQEIVMYKGIKALETAKQFTWENSAKRITELI